MRGLIYIESLVQTIGVSRMADFDQFHLITLVLLIITILKNCSMTSVFILLLSFEFTDHFVGRNICHWTMRQGWIHLV